MRRLWEDFLAFFGDVFEDLDETEWFWVFFMASAMTMIVIRVCSKYTV